MSLFAQNSSKFNMNFYVIWTFVLYELNLIKIQLMNLLLLLLCHIQWSTPRTPITVSSTMSGVTVLESCSILSVPLMYPGEVNRFHLFLEMRTQLLILFCRAHFALRSSPHFAGKKISPTLIMSRLCCCSIQEPSETETGNKKCGLG